MASNFPFARVLELDKNSDTTSEVSESGTNTSGGNSNWDAREELREFANKLGVRDVSELCRERFTVDRRKLEEMLAGIKFFSILISCKYKKKMY